MKYSIHTIYPQTIVSKQCFMYEGRVEQKRCRTVRWSKSKQILNHSYNAVA